MRKLTLVIRSIKGRIKFKPGVLSPTERPKRRTTPRSYCFTTLTVKGPKTSKTNPIRAMDHAFISILLLFIYLEFSDSMTHFRRKRKWRLAGKSLFEATFCQGNPSILVVSCRGKERHQEARPKLEDKGGIIF